jgi:hypothetical protein
MSVKQISVFLENKAGTLESMTDVLGKNQIDMRALSLAETKDFGIVRIIVDDVYEATTVLKETGYIHTLTPVVVIAIPDEPGGLNKILKVFTKAGVNIEYMYAFLGGADAKHAYMVFSPDDTKTAASAAKAAGMRLVDQEDISSL